MMFGLLVGAVCATGALGLRTLQPWNDFANLPGNDKNGDTDSYNYMPEEDLLVCACAKCGSTALFQFLYFQSFGHSWNYTGTPFIQDVVSPRWGLKFVRLDQARAMDVMAKGVTLSFALIRDPKSRITSAWKSKVACDYQHLGTDVDDRSRMVPALLRLAELPAADCLDFEGFLNALAVVHKKGLASELDIHFRPQNLECFRDFPPRQWSKVATISDASAAHLIARRFGNEKVTEFPRSHGSHHKNVNVTARAMELLDIVTKEEYDVLGDTQA